MGTIAWRLRLSRSIGICQMSGTDKLVDAPETEDSDGLIIIFGHRKTSFVLNQKDDELP